MISLYTRWNVTVCQVRSATLLQITSSDYIMLILIHWPHAHDACQLAYFNQILEFLVSMLNRTQLPDPNIFLRDRFLPRPSSYSKPNTYSYQPSIAVKFPTNECKIQKELKRAFIISNYFKISPSFRIGLFNFIFCLSEENCLSYRLSEENCLRRKYQDNEFNSN